MRAFLAFPTPVALQTQLFQLRRELSAPGLRFVEPAGVHLTLRFLGSATPAQLEALGRELCPAAAACPRGEARVFGLETFPPRGAPRVLVIGVKLERPARALQSTCEAAAVAAGFPPEARPFHPHLTLGRFKERARRPSLPARDLGTLPLDTLVLYASELRAGGAVHTKLAEFPLG